MKTKNGIRFWTSVIMGVILILSYSCEKQESEEIKDADGNVYTSVTIGTQVWMKENLKTTKYINGDPIPNITDDTQWTNLTTDAYWNFVNDISYATTYGRLYNCYTISDSRKICPTGWHIPTNAEWTILTDYLGGESVAGGKLKETGTVHWESQNTGATNVSGFTALPGGVRSTSFYLIENYGGWWSAIEGDASSAWYRFLTHDTSGVSTSTNGKAAGYSVRCLKD